MNIKKAIRYVAMFVHALIFWVLSLILFFFSALIGNHFMILSFFLLTAITTGAFLVTSFRFVTYVMEVKVW